MRILSKSLCTLVALLPVAITVERPHFYISRTESMPRGVYIETAQPLIQGALVVECLPVDLATFGKERGYLEKGEYPGNVTSVLKVIVGGPGSTVELSDAYVAVDDTLIPISASLTVDREGREIPRVERDTLTLESDEYFLLAPGVRSWDGRYYGPTLRENIKATVRPFLVESSE